MLFKKKEKTYEDSEYGRAKRQLDIEKENVDKINNIVSTIVTLVLFGLGIIGKEIFTIYLVGKGVGYLVNLFA